MMLGRRRKLYIDKRHGRIVALNMLIVGMVMIFFCAILFAPPVLVQYDAGSSAQERAEAADQLLWLHQTVWPALGFMLALLLFNSAVASHRIAGPLYRLRCVLSAARDGDLTQRARLRTHDHLHEEANELNSMLDALSGRLLHVEACIEKSNDMARLADKLLCEADLDGARRAVQNVWSTLDMAGEELQAVDLPGRDVEEPQSSPTQPDRQVANDAEHEVLTGQR